MANEDVGSEMPRTESAPVQSTLIEFPRAGRAAQPIWRKELNERVREIQERRSRETEREALERQAQRLNQALDESSGLPLGLVPQPDQPPLNPLVAAALKRIERAQQPPQRNHSRPGMRGASVAVARVAEEEFDQLETRPSLESTQTNQKAEISVESQPEARRAHSLSVVQSKVVAEESATAVPSVPIERKFQPFAAKSLELNQAEQPIADEFYDDFAPLTSRMAAGIIDLFVVAFASSPFAAIIELSNGDWNDERVVISMGAIFLIIMFLYLTSSTTIGGRTWGMSLLSLRAVDVDSGLPPTTKQSITRAFAYMMSIATFGLGILYALVDAEGRAVHDHLSGTTVVRE